ncbi:hypothetical protein B0H10DRAFT_1944808 [Mycena sp. CBHHK59/15]|nr:hypothetical protein B0H10DRAFT_1944808 [Mycena sp. CBHHK59/15]
MQAAPAPKETTNKPMDAPAGNDEDDAMGDGPPTPARRDATNMPVGTGDKEDDPMEDDPAAVLERENTHLKHQLAKALTSASANPPGGAGTVPVVTIPRLRRLAFISVLTTTWKRNMHDLVHQAGINWELPWAETPAEAKGKLFAVARDRHPILERFHNDWATEEMVKQYIANRRNTAYRRGDLEVPEKYNQTGPSAPRGRKAKVKVAAVKKAHKEKAAKVAWKQTSGAASRKAASSSNLKTKGKKKAAPAVIESEDEDKEMPEFEGSDDDN